VRRSTSPLRNFCNNDELLAPIALELTPSRLKRRDLTKKKIQFRLIKTEIFNLPDLNPLALMSNHQDHPNKQSKSIFAQANFNKKIDRNLIFVINKHDVSI